MGSLLDAIHFQVTEKALDMRQARQKLIASNMANVSTPQYQSRDIEFEDELRRASKHPEGQLYTTNPAHVHGNATLREFRPTFTTPNQAAMNNDLNSVDMEHEMMKMNENNIMYNALVTVLRKELESVDYAIREGGK